MPCGTCRQCLRGRDDMCMPFFAQNRLKGTLYDGTHPVAPRRRLPTGHVLDGRACRIFDRAGHRAGLPLGDDVPEVPAAILGCAAFTAYGAVHQTAALQPGESVAVVATGGVGSSIVQLARAAGAAMVIAVDVSDEKLAAAKQLGADHCVNSHSTDAVAAVRELTGGAGVDVAFEVLGRQQTFEQAVAMLTDGGRMVAVGIAAGASTANVQITPLVRRGLRLMGSFGGRTEPICRRSSTSPHQESSRSVTPSLGPIPSDG